MVARRGHQSPADRDRAAERRDRAAEQRDRAAEQSAIAGQDRDIAADKRDSIAGRRDVVADERDTVASRRDTVASRRDTMADEREGVSVAGGGDRAAEQRDIAREGRDSDARQRGIAETTRETSASERQRAEDLLVSEDELSARDRQGSADDRRESSRDRDRAARERHHTETELVLRAELLDLAHDAVIVRDPIESRVTFWNREAQAIYGYSAARATGQILHDLLATVFPESRTAFDEALVRDGRWDGVLRHTRRDGTVIVISSRQALQRDDAGRPTAVIELNSDITERHDAERRIHELNEDLARRAQQLRAANQELESWSDAIGRLAGGVAHELNNKLAVILGLNHRASEKLGDRHPLQHELGEVRIAAEHSAALTKDLLAFAGRQMLERQPIPAGQIAHDLRRLLGPALGTSIELVIEDRSDAAIVLVTSPS